jgi:2-keto-4-pentenoate hydratase/2-oxohepta-3-ene-1,7-dioic acid hydratase in catechol pathway
MRIARFRHQQNVGFGVIDGSNIKLIVGEPFGDLEFSGEELELGAVELLAPVMPSKVVCIGMNYSDHAAEIAIEVPEEPLIFFKPSSAIIASGQTIVLPHQSNQVELECELAVVVKKVSKNVSVDQAPEHILGYTIANDVTARDIQFSDLQWARSKAFDSFCPLGPWIETDFQPLDRKVESRVNGQIRQRASTREMNFDVFELFSYVTQNFTLNPGDVILTGSPAGISRIQSGDLVECEIEGIGVLTNPVA